MKKLIILLLFFSCGTKKTVTEFKEVVKRDSIYINVDRIITKQINDTITIDKPCDSLGQLKNFDRVIRTNNVKIALKSVKGNIQATVNIDSIVNSKITEFKKHYKNQVEIKEVVKIRKKVPFWVYVYIALSAIIIFLLIRKP